MPDELTDSGAPNAIEEQPVPTIDEKSPTAEFEAALQKALAPFVTKLDEVDSRTRSLQSEKDRGIRKVEGDVQKLLAEWEKARKTGVTEDEFADKLSEKNRLTLLEEKLASITAPTKPSGGTDGNVDALNVARAFAKAANIQENDPEYLKVIAVNATNPAAMIEGLSNLVVSRANKPKPTDAQSPSPVGSAPQPVDEAKLSAELARLQRYPSKNGARIEEIEKLLGW
jgi:hypothetical protein